MKGNKPFIPEKSIVDWLLQVALALEHMHYHNMLHRGVTQAENVLLCTLCEQLRSSPSFNANSCPSRLATPPPGGSRQRTFSFAPRATATPARVRLGDGRGR
ncbi:unnamed protein product [Closterium sp. NIES-65]|nr:unnamed protein product [Closterium sp. NIES-65]